MRPRPPTPQKAPARPVAMETKPRATPAAPATMIGAKAAANFPRKSVPTPPNRATPRASSNPVVSTATPANGQRRPANPGVTIKPDESFRRLQAQKAKAITTKLVTTAPKQRPATKPAPQPAPADIPPLVFVKQNSTQECPNCTAAVAADLKRCSCGYILSRPGEEVPAITLDATALAILTEGITFNSPNRRR